MHGDTQDLCFQPPWFQQCDIGYSMNFHCYVILDPDIVKNFFLYGRTSVTQKESSCHGITLFWNLWVSEKAWAITMGQRPLSKMIGYLPNQLAMKQNGCGNAFLYAVLDQNKFHFWIGYNGGPNKDVYLHVFKVRVPAPSFRCFLCRQRSILEVGVTSKSNWWETNSVLSLTSMQL